MTPTGDEFNDSWIVYPENGTDTSSFYKQPIKIAFNQASLQKFTSRRWSCSPFHFRSFCSLLSAARAVLFCGSKAKACLKSASATDYARSK
jgi:hypothetical protein